MKIILLCLFLCSCAPNVYSVKKEKKTEAYYKNKKQNVIVICSFIFTIHIIMTQKWD